MPIAEPEDLWEKYFLNRTPGNRNKLVVHYLPVVQAISRKIHSKLPASIELGDLESVGTTGLIFAVENFDHGRAVKFSTYCGHRIHGAILDELRSRDWVPRLVRQRITKLDKARAEDEVSGTQSPNATLAKRIGVSLVEFNKSYAGLIEVEQMSFDICISGDNGAEAPIKELLEDTAAEPPEWGVTRGDFLKEICLGMNKRERLIIILYYYEKLTMSEVGEAIGVTESRVSQLHKDLLARVRQRLQGKKPDLIEGWPSS